MVHNLFALRRHLHEGVLMPRGVYERKPKVAQDDDMVSTALSASEPDDEADICEQCWPAGWSGDDVAASCVHGQWARLSDR